MDHYTELTLLAIPRHDITYTHTHTLNIGAS